MGSTPGALTQDNPARLERDLTIASDRIAGATYSQLAKKYGISKGRICQIINDDDIQPIINQGRKQIASLIPKAADNYISFLSSDNEKIRLTATQDVLKIVDILQSHAGNNYFTNIQNNYGNVINPVVANMLHKYHADHEAHDAEFEDILEDD